MAARAVSRRDEWGRERPSGKRCVIEAFRVSPQTTPTMGTDVAVHKQQPFRRLGTGLTAVPEESVQAPVAEPETPEETPAPTATPETAADGRRVFNNSPQILQMQAAIQSLLPPPVLPADPEREALVDSLTEAQTSLSDAQDARPPNVRVIENAAYNVEVARVELLVYDQEQADVRNAQTRFDLFRDVQDAQKTLDDLRDGGTTSPRAIENASNQLQQAEDALAQHDRRVTQRHKREYDAAHAQLERFSAAGQPAPEVLEERFQDLENGFDSFRSSLFPSEQAAYDAWLEEIENDPGIVFEVDPDIDLAVEGDSVAFNQNLTYRAIAASTFRREDRHRDKFSADDPLTIELLADHPTVTGSDGRPRVVGAIAQSGDNRIIIRYDEAEQRLLSGNTRNVMAHEYIHQLQEGSVIPTDVPNAAEEIDNLTHIFNEARASGGSESGLRALLADDYPGYDSRWYGDDGTINVEPYAVAAGYFYERPDVLREASPALYALMVRTTGVDPLAASGPVP